MVEWLRYAVRVAAAFLLGMCCLVSAVTAFSGEKSRVPIAVTAAVFGVGCLATWPRRPNAWRRDHPTERQVAYATDLGIRVRRGMSKGELSDLISQAKAARDAD